MMGSVLGALVLLTMLPSLTDDRFSGIGFLVVRNWQCRFSTPEGIAESLVAVKNAVSTDKRDVSIRDKFGRKAYYIRAPGEYTVNFDNIKVEKNLGHLSGDVTAKIQVPLIDAGFGLRFDVPYQAIPETGLLAARCDEQSTVVEYNNKQYCRYCDLCTTSAEVEEQLKRERLHKYLRSLGRDKQSSFSEVCTEIEEGKYEIHRKLTVPSKEKLESIARESTKGLKLSEELRSRLEKNAGRIQECLPPNAEPIACTIAEFQYTLTEDKAVVRRFLTDHGIEHDPDLDNVKPPEAKEPAPFRSRPPPPSSPSTGLRAYQKRCLKELSGIQEKICRNFFKDHFCCKHCDGGCAPN